ncbi:MAG: ParA family protein [Actinomycetota bacterium]|nr:ParA family protein [Actinomycetota bacterium]
MASTQGKEQLKNKKMILSVISNKGGVGKTSIAVSLAFYLSDELGKTLLLELDSSPGGLEALFDLREDDYLEVAIKFPESYKSNLKNIFHNLDVMKGFKSPIIAENIKPGDTKKLINRIKKDYQFVVVDTQTVMNGIILDF